MSDKPKQWGPHASPEGLGKLRTAVATLPDQKYVSVSGLYGLVCSSAENLIAHLGVRFE